MIEVNLLPGATRRPSRRRRAWKLPAINFGLGQFNGTMAGVVAAWLICLIAGGWTFFHNQSRQAELTLNLEKATQDSAHYATIIAANARMKARRDSIASKLELIQDIDADRYTWAHVLDEVSRALPAYTWLMTITEVPDTSSESLRIQIDGRTGNTLALTEFMKDLEQSPFMRNVRLISTSIVTEEQRELHSFSLDVLYEKPPADAIQTVPLFQPEE